MSLFVYPLPGLDPVTAFAAVHDRPYSLFFDSADKEHPNARFSFVVYHPIEIIESKDGKVSVANRDQSLSFRADPFTVLSDRIAAWGTGAQSRDDLPPFQGGAAGLFGYDLVRGLEKLPEIAIGDPNMPDMAVGIYDQTLAFDHATGGAWLIVQTAQETTAHARLVQLDRLLEASRGLPEMAVGESQWTANMTRNDYENRVTRVMTHIRAGDIFQANLSQRFDAQLPNDFDSFAHYLSLRNVNPAPFGSYMNFGAIRLASASPERFLSLRENRVETRPIKGTRPRHDDPHVDTLFRNELENSAKDRAENVMIVDLLRNDLSRVCTDPSVHTSDICRIESFAQVHHFVSTVTGTLRTDQGPVDLLRACFPGGSITGAPKIKAMEIIESLEPTRRGPYCGATGYIGFDGVMDSAIAIRTLVYSGNQVSFQTGGGITLDSVPSEEYEETLAKAEGIFRSFESSAPLGKVANSR
ncbi:MAG: aminodeoxychorismate synthase component I [Rhodospirillales bacterium]|nr:aminodeoxychorismate synthase component I [Rhodospirillales bacterium]